MNGRSSLDAGTTAFSKIMCSRDQQIDRELTRSRDHTMCDHHAGPRLSLVIPAYNEARLLLLAGALLPRASGSATARRYWYDDR